MSTLITVLHVIVCLFLMLTVLLQSGKGGGMGAAFGGGNAATVFGGSGASGFLKRLTAIAGTIFMCTSMVLAFLSSRNSADALDSFGKEEADKKKEKDEAKARALKAARAGSGSAAGSGAMINPYQLPAPGSGMIKLTPGSGAIQLTPGSGSAKGPAEAPPPAPTGSATDPKGSATAPAGSAKPATPLVPLKPLTPAPGSGSSK
jgi:preprotein translocase subunit SecG